MVFTSHCLSQISHKYSEEYFEQFRYGDIPWKVIVLSCQELTLKIYFVLYNFSISP